MFFDIKNHLLYGIESYFMCAMDELMAMGMAGEAYLQGCRYIIATPSNSAFLSELKCDDSEGIPAWIWARYQSLKKRIRSVMPDMYLGLGCEIHCSRSNVDEIIFHLKKKHLPTMNHTQYILISFPNDISREDLWYCLNRLDREGYMPILSHAQMLHTLRNDIHEIRCLKGEAYRDPHYRFRALIQVDMLSLHFSEPNNWSREMIRSGVVDMLATDAQNSFTNPPHIREELADISGIYSREYLEAISWRNAAEKLMKT